MGSLCQYQKKESMENYSKPVNNEIRKLIGCNLSFSVARPSEMQAQMFMIFQDQQCRASQNDVLNIEESHIGQKVQQYIDVYRQDSHMEVGNFAIMSVDIENFPFQKLGVLCVEVWPGDSGQLLSPLEEDIEEALNEITKNSIKSLIITELNEQLGIPKQIAYKTLCRAVMKKMEQFDTIIVLCKSQQSADAHNQTFNRLQQLSQSFVSKVDEASDYY